MPPFHSVQGPTHEVVLPTFRVGLPSFSQANPIETSSWGHPSRVNLNDLANQLRQLVNLWLFHGTVVYCLLSQSTETRATNCELHVHGPFWGRMRVGGKTVSLLPQGPSSSLTPSWPSSVGSRSFTWSLRWASTTEMGAFLYGGRSAQFSKVTRGLEGGAGQDTSISGWDLGPGILTSWALWA